MAREFPSVDFCFGVADEGLLPGFSLRVLSEKPSTADSRTYSSFQEKPCVNRKKCPNPFSSLPLTTSRISKHCFFPCNSLQIDGVLCSETRSKSAKTDRLLHKFVRTGCSLTKKGVLTLDKRMMQRLAVWCLSAFVLFTVFRQFSGERTVAGNLDQTS